MNGNKNSSLDHILEKVNLIEYRNSKPFSVKVSSNLQALFLKGGLATSNERV